MSVVPFARPARPPVAVTVRAKHGSAVTEPLTRFTIFVLVEAALQQAGRRSVEVTITPRCACGCSKFVVKLMPPEGIGIKYAVNGMRLQRAAVEIAEMVAALPGARDVN